MIRYPVRRVSVFGLCVAIVAAFSGAGLCQPCEKMAGKMVSVQGTVEARRAGETIWQSVALNDTFCPGDTIRVGSRSRADLILSTQSVLRIDEHSEFTLEGVTAENAGRLNMFKGAAHFFSRKPRATASR